MTSSPSLLVCHQDQVPHMNCSIRRGRLPSSNVNDSLRPSRAGTDNVELSSSIVTDSNHQLSNSFTPCPNTASLLHPMPTLYETMCPMKNHTVPLTQAALSHWGLALMTWALTSQLAEDLQKPPKSSGRKKRCQRLQRTSGMTDDEDVNNVV